MFKQLIDKARELFKDNTQTVLEKSREQEIISLLTQLEEKTDLLKSDLDSDKITDEVFLKSFTELRSLESELKEELEGLEKGGEGSKGGKIIGHTKSGKAKYATKGKAHAEMYKMADKMNYDHSSPEDTHDLALEAHEKGISHEHIHSWIKEMHDQGEEEMPFSEQSPDQKLTRFANSVVKRLPKEKTAIHKSEQTETDTIEKSDTKTYYVDCLIHDNKNKLLLLRRSNFKTFEGNKWSLPGGKIDAGENIMQAVLREVLEETNIKLTADKVRLVAVKETDDVCIYYFRSDLYGDDLKLLETIVLDNAEHINYQFMTQEERKKMKLLLDLNDTLDTLQNYSYDKNSEVKVPLLNSTNEANGQKTVKIEDLKSE